MDDSLEHPHTREKAVSLVKAFRDNRISLKEFLSESGLQSMCFECCYDFDKESRELLLLASDIWCGPPPFSCFETEGEWNDAIEKLNALIQQIENG